MLEILPTATTGESDSHPCRLKETLIKRLCRYLLSCCLGLLTVSFVVPVASQQNLPAMGEPADTALSPREEQQLGAQFMRQIRARLPLVRDVQLSEFVQNLGQKLVSSSGRGDMGDFTFFIIDDPQINAFAIPGGYVGINAGLISAMQHEEQLAGVVAHEIAHVTQRHHARAFATGNQASLNAAATILAAIIIGQASPQAGQAALAAGLAASQQSAINFTRGNEIEADRIGIEILANAKYDPSAMAESFSILRRKNSLNTSGGQLEYLRTHPLDNNRIAEAADRASVRPRKQRVDPTDYQLFRARLAVLGSDDISQLSRSFLAGYQRSPSAENTYALALINHRKNRHSEALRYLNELEKLAPTHPMVLLLKSDIVASDPNNYDDSQLEALTELYPNRYSIVEKRLEQLIRLRRHAEAMQIAKRYLRDTRKPNPLAWRTLANIQERLNDDAASHESLARYFVAISETERAVKQLELALQGVSEESQDFIRLNAAIKTLNNEAARLR